MDGGEIHRVIGHVIVRGYGWDGWFDELGHGFHPAGRDARYMIGSAAQWEILDRLLVLDRVCFVEEVAAGLYDKKAAGLPDKKARESEPVQDDGILF